MNKTNGWWTLNPPIPPKNKPEPPKPQWQLEPLEPKTKRSEYRAQATNR